MMLLLLLLPDVQVLGLEQLIPPTGLYSTTCNAAWPLDCCDVGA
jgi:hypothetical protein